MNSAPSATPLKQFVEAAHRVAHDGLLFCSSGNMSWRIAGGRMLITGTGCWLGTLTPNRVSVCRIRDGAVLAGCKPSKETGFHAGVLRARRDVNVVLHFQSPYATTLACCRTRTPNYFVVPEVPYYVGPVISLPYLSPGTRRLATAVVSALRRHDLVVLRNHGQITVGRDFDDAIQKATFFELACRILLGAGKRVRSIPPRGVNELLAQRRALRSKGVHAPAN